MRGLGLVVLVLILALPAASAQASPAPVVVTIEPMGEPVRPLQGTLSFPVAVTASCPPTAALPPGGRIDYVIDRIPAWAAATISPTTDGFDWSQCADGRITRRATLTVTASDQAPAFAPELVRVVVSVTLPLGESATGRGEVPIVAGYFSIIDASTADSVKRGRAGDPVAFTIRMTNFGNAATRLAFSIERAADGLTVRAPDPIILQSKQAGGVVTASDVVVTAMRSPGAVGDLPFVVRYHATYALDSKLLGDSGTFALMIDGGGTTVPLPEPEEDASFDPRELPLSPLPAIAAAALAALLRRRP